MKNFFTVGKWSVLLLLGAGLLFAGCMGPSSDDSAIPAKAGGMGAKYVYKFSVNPTAQTLDIEPVVMGTAVQTTHFGGTVEVTSSGCSGTDPFSCQITFKNLTAGQYMSRMRTWEYSCKNTAIGCTESATATLSTSDYGSSLIAGGSGGMCLLEDGTWGHRQTSGPWNLECPIYLYGGFTETLQFLHPDCGSMTDTWTFTNESNPYQFYTALTDTLAGSTLGGILGGMYPEDVTADGRFDPNRTTFVVKAYNLDNQWCDGGSCYAAYAQQACLGPDNPVDGYKLGAPGCSTPIAEGQTLAAGQYFAVAAGFEWPDRIENQNHGQRCRMTVTNVIGPCNQTGLSCYEWPNEMGMVYYFDGSVLEPVTVTTVTPGSTVLTVDGPQEIYYGNKKAYADTNDGINDTPNYIGESNYIYYYRPSPAGVFNFKTGGYNLLTCFISVRENVGRAWFDPRPIATNGAVPDYLASGGNVGAYGWTGLAEYYITGLNRCDIQDLPQDAAEDYWGLLQYFRVKPGAPAGSGSIIKVEPNAGNSMIKWFGSNCTRGGGYLGDDISLWYWPCSGPPCAGTGSGVSTPTTLEKDPGTYIWVTLETSNPLMPGGFNAHAGKGKQAQNDHICVGP